MEAVVVTGRPPDPAGGISMTRSTTRSATRAMTIVVALATMLMMVVGVAGTAEAKPRTATPTPVAITPADSGGAVDGVFNVSRFAVQNGKLTALGTFTGSVTNAA